MKAEIRADGTMVVSAETSTEAYAPTCWSAASSDWVAPFEDVHGGIKPASSCWRASAPMADYSRPPPGAAS